jgi:hypothetical protein
MRDNTARARLSHIRTRTRRHLFCRQDQPHPSNRSGLKAAGHNDVCSTLTAHIMEIFSNRRERL